MRVANTYWVDERIRTQRALPRAHTSVASVQQISQELIGTRAEVRRRGGIVPSWVVFGMILLATFAVCMTVNMRTRAKLQVASEQFAAIQNEVETERSVNLLLQTEIEKLKSDPRAVESAAKARLNMIRSNEYLVPLE